MSASVLPQFGKRTGDPQPMIVAAPEINVDTGPSAQAINEIRTLCLSRLEPGAVAGMSSERLAADMERLISEIATQNRIQLNAREQRGLATELVHDIVGLGPLEPLLADDTISDIMVNGPDRIFVERRGKTV
jgi:pilus assembly protein CpaF